MTGLSDDLVDLASDYVLGLLSGGEARLFEEIIDRDAELARQVGELRDRLLPLDLSATAQVHSEGLLDRVRAEIKAGQASELPAATLRAPQVKPAIARGAQMRSSFGLIAASLVGAAVGFWAGWLQPQPEPRVIAVLLDGAGVPQAVVEDYGNDTATVRFVAEVDIPLNRSLQVWTLPSTELGAMSLGVLDRVGPTQLSFDTLPGPSAQQLYEITLEPAGGSPTGRPTGPIVGKGLAAEQL